MKNWSRLNRVGGMHIWEREIGFSQEAEEANTSFQNSELEVRKDIIS